MNYPSWLYAINLGATTIWERWNSLTPDGTISSIGMNSLNHYAYGSIVEWMFRDMYGLNPSLNKDGVTYGLPPCTKPDSALQWAEARYHSAASFYESSWSFDERENLTLEITILINASARIVLPHAQLGDISINDHPLHEGEQIGDHVELTLGAGAYKFEYLFRVKNS